MYTLTLNISLKKEISRKFLLSFSLNAFIHVKNFPYVKKAFNFPKLLQTTLLNS